MATTSDAPKTKGKGTKRALILGLIIIVLAGSIFASRLVLRPEQSDIASVLVKQDEFVISLVLKGGELEAIEAEQITAPRVRGELKITELFPEGETAEVGDLLVRFEETEFQKQITEREQQYEQAKAELEKTQAQQRAETASLKAEIENQEANLRLAELQVERQKFEAAITRETTAIQAKQAQLSRDKAVQKLESQVIIDSADIKRKELDISRAKRRFDKAKDDFENLRIVAEKPGLVVYGKMWKGSGLEKIRVGDNVWGGVKVISLPNLAHMQVKTTVNEVDVDKLEVDQQVLIKLDALPAPTFHGSITSIASLGRQKEGEKNVKVFDVVVAIDEEDERLKPGMSASSEVIVEVVPPRPQAKPDSVADETDVEVADVEVADETDVEVAVVEMADETDVEMAVVEVTDETDVEMVAVEVADETDVEVADVSQPLPLYIPLDAVFESGGQTVVYRLDNGTPVEQVVTLGKRNDNYVIVEEGLGPEDRVTLNNPTLGAGHIGGLDEKTASQLSDVAAQ